MFVCVETVLEEGSDGTAVRFRKHFRKHKLTVETVELASAAASSRILRHQSDRPLCQSRRFYENCRHRFQTMLQRLR